MAYPSHRPRVWEQSEAVWKPRVTYGLLVAMAAVFVLELVLGRWAPFLFVIATDWIVRPWTLVTSTLAHGSVQHILFNGLFLFFFGPNAERILGTKRFLWLFLGAGALSGVLQVHIQAWADDLPYEPALVMGEGVSGALGASGALMAMFGFLMVLMPKQQLLIWGLVPAPFWAMGVFYIVLDLAGALGPDDGIGHYAHLSGLALGAIAGFLLRRQMRERGLTLVVD